MRVLAVFAAGYASAVFGSTLLLPEGLLLPLGGFCALLALVFAIFRRHSPGRLRKYALLACAGAAAGFCWTWGYARLFLEPARALDGRTVVLSGVVYDYPKETEYGGSVLIRAQLEGGVEVNTLLYVDEAYLGLQPGDRVSSVARCTLATHTADGEEITFYTAKGIFLTAAAYGEMDILRPQRIPVRCWPALLSRRLKEGIDSSFSSRTAPLVKALVTGNRDGLSDSYTSSLQRTGLSHVVAVSGMHVAFLGAVLSFLLGRGRRRAALLSLPVIALFVVVAGCTPSVVRAGVMIALLQLAPLFGRERDDVTALAFALLVLLVQNPYAAASIGLQLSFAAVAGILLCAGRLQGRMDASLHLDRWADSTPLRVLGRLGRWVTGVVSATLGALVFTTPLVMLYFGQLSLVAPLANLLTIWAVSLTFVGGLLVGIVGALSPAAGDIAALAVEPFARYLDAMVPFVARLPLAAVPGEVAYYRLWVLLVYGILVLALLMPGRKRALIPVLGTGAALCAAVLFTNLTLHAGSMTVQVLDVGQGQSVLIRAGDRLALVDCGGDGYENAGDIAADQIQAMGRSSLDLLVVSHYHFDHANGIPELMERLDVGTIALPDVEEESMLRGRILEQAQRHGVEVLFVREDTRLELGDDAVFTIYPPLGEGSTNELGLTVLCSSGEFDVLLTGDMGASVEELLVEHARLPDVEIMVAGHHGSKYANSRLLLETVTPDAAIFSVGADNGYGHPTREAMERFAQVGAQLYRTDQMGTVTITLN